MAAIDLSQNSIQALADAVRGSSGSFSSAPNTEGGSSESERAERANNIRYSAATKDLKTASKAFDNISKTQNKTADQIKKQVDLNSHFVSSAVTGMSNLKFDSKAFDKLEDMFKKEEELKIVQDMKVALEKLQTGVAFDNAEYDILVNRLDDVGSSFEDMGIMVEDATHNGQRYVHVTEDVTKSNETLSKRANKLSKSLKKDSDALERHTKIVKKSKELAKGIAAAAVVTAKLAIDEARVAQRLGTGEITGTPIEAAKLVARLRISTQEYMEVLGHTRIIQRSMNQSGMNFTEELVLSSQELLKYSATTHEAAQNTAAMIDNVASFGVKFNDLESPMERQRALYAKNFRGMSITIGQFNEMTSELLANSDVRNDIAKLDKKQRQLYIESLQLRASENIQAGYSIERAKELNAHFAQISGMNPLDRLKKAAQERAFLGAIGMEKEGAELQRLTNTFEQMDAAGKVAAQARMTEIREQVAATVQAKRAEGGGQQYAIGAMMDRFNLTYDKYLTVAQEAKKIDLSAISAQDKQAAETNKIQRGFVIAADGIKAGLLSSSTAAVTMAGSWIFGKGMQKAMGGIGGALDILTGTALAGASPAVIAALGATAAGAIIGTGAFSVAEIIQSGGKKSSLSSLVQENAPEMYDAIGGTLSELFGDEASLTGQQLKELRESNKLKKEEMAQHAKEVAAAEERRERQHQEIQQRQKALTDKWTVGVMVDKLPLASTSGG